MAAIRRILVALVAFAATGAGLVVGTGSPAYACTCAQEALGSLAKDAGAVFIGTAEKVRTEGDMRLYTFRVSAVYSGSAAPTTTVRTPADSAVCGIALKLKHQYMVLGEQDQPHGDVATTLCSGTQPISDRVIEEVERSLGPATPYRGMPDKDMDGAQKGTNAGRDDDGQTSQGTVGSDGTANADTTDRAADGADGSADGENTSSQVVVGVLLAIAIGASFLLPRLRRRNRQRRIEPGDGE